MSSRPTDWSPLGLSGDPTPGDYDSVMAVSTYMQAINTSAGVVKQGLDAIYGTATSTENFAGQTATALTGLITKELHNFLENVATSFAEASAAVSTFAAALQEQQSVADTALSQAQGLNKTTDAAQIQSLANTASGAGDTLGSASSIASTAVDNAASLVTWPDTFWDRFWEALGWLAIFLMIPAILFGGGFALLAFGLNFILFIKSAVDFFSGKESAGAFLLSFLGILAPTTEPLDVLGILKGLITGIKSLGSASVTFLSDGIKTFGNLIELFGGARLFLNAIPELALDVVKVGGLYVVDTIKSIPAFVAAGGKLLLDGITGLPKTISTELGGTKWLRIFLPVTAKEIDVVGLGGALRLGVLERGLGFSADPVLNFRMAIQEIKVGAPGLIKLSSLSSDLHLADFKGGDLVHLDPANSVLSTLRPEFSPHLTINPADLSAPSRMAINRLDESVLLQNPTELTHLFNHEAIVINTGDMTIVKFTEGIRPASVPSLGAPAHVGSLESVTTSITPLVTDFKLAGFSADLKVVSTTPISTTVNTVTSLLHDPQRALDLLDHTGGTNLGTQGVSSAVPKDLAGTPGLSGGFHTTVTTGAHTAVTNGAHTAVTSSGDLVDKGKAPAFDPADAGTVGSLDGHAVPLPLRPDQIGPVTLQDAWLSYQAAHIDVANAAEKVDRFAGKVGESSTGMSAAEQQAHAEMTDALDRLDRANVEMTDLGADPLQWMKWQYDADQAYLKEHPGLLGGGKQPTREVDLRNARNEHIGTTTLHYDTRTGELARPNGITDPLHFDQLENGVFRVYDPVSPLEWRQFTANGVLHSTNHLILDKVGDVVGEMRVNAAGTRAVTEINGVQHAWEYTGHADGGFTLTAPGTGVHELYDAMHVHIETRTDLLRPGGTPLGTAIVTDLRGPNPVHSLTGTGGFDTLTALRPGWRLEESATGHFSLFDADGVLTHEGFLVRAPGGRDLGVYTHDYAAHTHTITRPDGTIETYHATPGPNGTMRFVDTADANHWVQMDGHGNVGAESHTVDPTRVIELDHTAGTAEIIENAATRHGGAFTVDHAGNVTVTDAATGVREVFGPDFQHLETQTDLFAHNGNAFNATVTADFRGAVPQYRATGPGSAGHALTPVHGGGWELRDPLTGRGHRFDADGRQTDEIFTLHAVQGGGAAGAGGGADLGEVDFDLATGDGTFRPAGGGPARQITVTPTAAGGWRVTDRADNRFWLESDGNRNLITEGRGTNRPGGAPDGTLTIYHVADNTHAANSATTAENGFGTDWDRYTANADGTYDLHGPNGALRHYDVQNALVEEHVPLRNTGTRAGLVLHADYRGGAPVYAVHDPNGAMPHVNTVAHHGGVRVTDTRAGAGGGYKSFDRYGVITDERIPVLDRKGGWNQTSYQVDYAAVPGGPARATWTLVDDRTGNAFTSTRGMPGNRTRPAYNAAGDVRVQPNGDLHLIGGDGTPVFMRENPGGARGFELFRDGAGKRYWHEFSADGRGFHTEPVNSGTRDFGTEPDAAVYKDVTSGGRTVRTFRKALDGGTVRADRMPDGTWRWTRFDSRGNETLSGVRTFSPTGDGWTDKAIVNGVEHVAQRQYSRLSFSGTAAHYREYAIDGGPGAYAVRPNYKEISPQAKDTGSASGPLTATRLSEQRPPHWLWKTTDNLSWYDKTFAYFFGRKYGALDFPHNGWILGDSRLQVFRWEETAGGVSTRGVRAVLPDGSSADFTEAGLFARGTTKLETGHAIEVKTDVTPPGHAGPGRALVWKKTDANKQVVDSGFRYYVDDHDWVEVSDPFANPAVPHPAYQPGVQSITRMSVHDNGDVIEFTDPAHRPTFDPATNAVTAHPLGDGSSITRNSLGQIVGRTDQWHAGTATGLGDARTGEWHWTDSTGAAGTRISSRNTRWTGSWDDSYTDFRQVNGQWQIVHDYRSLDKGTSLTAEFDAASNRWRSVYRDARGNEVVDAAHPPGFRQFDHGGGDWREVPPPGKLNAPWRDVHPTRLDPHGNPLVLRQTFDGRVRIYSTTDHTGNAWKEYDDGAVFRERKAAPDGSGLWRETQSWQKQWRETTAAGDLVRYRALSGRVWERSPLGRWKMVGREFEYHSLTNEFRGYNRSLREVNRREYTVADGAVGHFHGEGHNIGQKALLDFAQDYVLDVVANIIITGAENNWDYTGDDWGKIFLGGALSGGVKTLGGVLHEKSSRLKGTKDGIANVDGGKDFNRNPYNHDKTWDNEWAGNETPPRWRSTMYDYSVSTLAFGMLGSFVSNTVTAALFGVGSDHVKEYGADALKVGGISALGTLSGGVVVGLPKTIAHQLSSGRLFHRGGVADLTLIFGEKLFEKWSINYKLIPALGLKPHATAPTSTDTAEQNQG